MESYSAFGDDPIYVTSGYQTIPQRKAISEDEEFFLSDQEIYDADAHKEESFTVSAERTEILVNDVIDLIITQEPGNANAPEVVIESSDEAVIKAFGQGKIIALSLGEATITVSDAYDPSLTATLDFMVVEKEAPVDEEEANPTQG